MIRLFSIVILLVVFGVNSSWGNSTSSPRKCIFELYQFRSPVISGCSLQYNSNGLTEVYVYSKKGQFGQSQVYTGQPGFGPQPGEKGVIVKQKCPRTVVSELDKMLKGSEVGSFEGAKNAIKKYSALFMQGEMRVATVSFEGGLDDFDGDVSMLGGGFAVNLAAEGGNDRFISGSIDNGMSIKFRDATTSTLTIQGDFGALDYKGGCN